MEHWHKRTPINGQKNDGDVNAHLARQDDMLTWNSFTSHHNGPFRLLEDDKDASTQLDRVQHSDVTMGIMCAMICLITPE